MSFPLILFACLIAGCLVSAYFERSWRPKLTITQASQTEYTHQAVLDVIANKLNLQRLTIQGACGEKVHFVNNQVADQINRLVCRS